MPDNSQSLALRSVVAHELEAVQRVLQEARNRAHILTPFARSNIPLIPDGWDVYFHQYKISTTTEQDANGYLTYPDGEVYPLKGTNRVALTKIGLWRLEQLAGVSWEDPRTGGSTIHRIDDWKDSHVCRYQTTGYIRDIDGQIRSQSDGFGYDLRDGSPQAIAMKGGELPKARQNIEQLTITKCKLRVLRSLLGIQSSYKPEELEKPFVVLKMAFNIDKLDVDIKRELHTILAAKQMGIEKELFGLVAAKTSRILADSDAAANATLPPAQAEVHPPLELPPITDPVQPLHEEEQGPDDIAERQYWETREAQIRRIDNLYILKKGRSRAELSPGKPSLVSLDEKSLVEIEAALTKLPDLPRKDLI